MGKLRTGHLVEAGLWLGLCLFLYIYSFEFDQEHRNLQVRRNRLAARHYPVDDGRRTRPAVSPLEYAAMKSRRKL